MDPDVLKRGGGAMYQARCHFIANAYHELCAFYTGKAMDLLKNYKVVWGGALSCNPSSLESATLRGVRDVTTATSKGFHRKTDLEKTIEFSR